MGSSGSQTGGRGGGGGWGGATRKGVQGGKKEGIFSMCPLSLCCLHLCNSHTEATDNGRLCSRLIGWAACDAGRNIFLLQEVVGCFLPSSRIVLLFPASLPALGEKRCSAQSGWLMCPECGSGRELVSRAGTGSWWEQEHFCAAVSSSWASVLRGELDIVEQMMSAHVCVCVHVETSSQTLRVMKQHRVQSRRRPWCR